VTALSFTSLNGDFSNEKEHNMRYQETSSEVSKMPNGTSDNANIICNFKNPLVSREQTKLQGRYKKW